MAGISEGHNLCTACPGLDQNHSLVSAWQYKGRNYILDSACLGKLHNMNGESHVDVTQTV